MPTLPMTQQSDWNNNVYVLATTRVIVMIGLAYLIKSLYNLVPAIWGTRSASVAAAVLADDIGLANIAPDTPVMVPGAVDIGPDLEANLTLGFRPPQPMYDPQYHIAGSRANARIQNQNQNTEVSGQSTAAQTMPEHEVGLRNDGRHIEGHGHTAKGHARQETTNVSAVDGEIGETTTPPPEDTISPSLDA